MQLIPYLFYKGNCEEAFRYYARHLGGEIVAMMTHQGTPAEDHVAPEQKNKIMHACMNIGGAMLMASDESPDTYKIPNGMRVSLQIDEADEAERAFAALADGGEISMGIEETFWAQRFGMCRDRFGIPWMVNCPKAGE